MSAPTEKELADLRANIPRCVELEVGDQTFVVGPVPRAAYRAYMNALAEEPRRVYDAHEALVKNGILWPDAATSDRFFDANPSLVIPMGAEIAKVCRHEGEVVVKKR